MTHRCCAEVNSWSGSDGRERAAGLEPAAALCVEVVEARRVDGEPASTLIAIPVVIFFLLVQRRIAFGLTTGAVKA